MIYRWLVFNSFTVFITAYLVQYYDGFTWLGNSDPTKISFAILLFYVMISGYIGYGASGRCDVRSSIVKHVSTSLVGLGLIGTVIGMMHIFGSLDVSDFKQVIPELMRGIATAQVSTLFGLSSAWLISQQYFLVFGRPEDDR
jgi:hypothetical protein